MLFLLLIFLLLFLLLVSVPIFLLLSSFSGEVDITRPPPGFSEHPQAGVSTGTRYCTVHCSKFGWLVFPYFQTSSNCRASFAADTRSLVFSYTRTLVLSYTRTLVLPCFDLYLSRPKTSVPRGHAQSRAMVRADLADLADASQTRSQPQAEIHLVRILSFPCVILASLI